MTKMAAKWLKLIPNLWPIRSTPCPHRLVAHQANHSTIKITAHKIWFSLPPCRESHTINYLLNSVLKKKVAWYSNHIPSITVCAHGPSGMTFLVFTLFKRRSAKCSSSRCFCSSFLEYIWNLINPWGVSLRSCFITSSSGNNSYEQRFN